MRFGCLLDKARNTHSEYVEHIRFPHQQQLHIRKSIHFYHYHVVAYPGILFGRVSTNSVEDREQRERGYGDGSPVVRVFLN